MDTRNSNFTGGQDFLSPEPHGNGDPITLPRDPTPAPAVSPLTSGTPFGPTCNVCTMPIPLFFPLLEDRQMYCSYCE